MEVEVYAEGGGVCLIVGAVVVGADAVEAREMGIWVCV